MNATLLKITAACSGGGICLDGLPTTSADSSFVQNAIQLVIAIVAALSVLFVALGGMRYILSQGDPQAIQKAKGSIVYALIGLAVAVLAQVIVVFIIRGLS